MKDHKFSLVTFIFLTIISLFFYACDEDEEPLATQPQCERTAIVSNSRYNDAKDESDFSIREVSINGNCMTIAYTYGGGCGTIYTDLVAGEESIQHTGNLRYRDCKLSIDDQDNCEALITKSEEFDISALQGEGNSIILKLHKWDADIVYEY